MRKTRKIALMLIAEVFCLVCFTWCIRYNVTVDVKGNGKADLSMMYSSQVSGVTMSLKMIKQLIQ